MNSAFFQPGFESEYFMENEQDKTHFQQIDPWLKRLNQHIDTALPNTELSNSELAELMELSERQFYRTLRKLTGYSPNQYLTKYRLKKAIEYIKSGQYQTVREIAYSVGYKKDSYFSMLFKKEYKESPLDTLRRAGVR